MEAYSILFLRYGLVNSAIAVLTRHARLLTKLRLTWSRRCMPTLYADLNFNILGLPDFMDHVPNYTLSF